MSHTHTLLAQSRGPARSQGRAQPAEEECPGVWHEDRGEGLQPGSVLRAVSMLWGHSPLERGVGLESGLALAGTQPAPQPCPYLLGAAQGAWLLPPGSPSLGASQPAMQSSFQLSTPSVPPWQSLSGSWGSLVSFELSIQAVLPRPASWPELPLGPDPMGLVAPVVPRTSPG